MPQPPIECLYQLDNAVLLCPLHDFGNVSEGETRNGVGAAIIYSYATCLGVVYFGAREANVRYIAHTLVRSLRSDELWTRTMGCLPGLFEVEQSRTESVNVAVARAKHAVIEQQPTLRCLNGHRTCTDLHALPC